jgi:hypothetical protein
MLDHRYMLIRYVPDAERMEPINVGIILQGQGKVDVRLNPHATKRKEVDTPAFRKWKQFFNEEVTGDTVPLFQPDKTSPRFLQYLEELCEGPILLTRPLTVSVQSSSAFSEVFEDLFERLVLPPERVSAVENQRPTGRFRKIADERQFRQRGMKSYVHVPTTSSQSQSWMAYRQVLNGEYIAIDKVEVARELGRTATEIDKLMLVKSLLQQFIENKIVGKSTRYVLLADEMPEPFAEQSADEFQAMRNDLDSTADHIRKLGGQVLRSSAESEHFANELDQKLPKAVTNVGE